MDEFSGIRATARPNRDDPMRGSRSSVAAIALASLVLVLLAPPGARPRAAEHAPEAPPAATTAPAQAEIKPPQPSAERPPPPRLNGPIAAPAPKVRTTYVADATTGRALGGYDPVAYFLVGHPTLGEPERQYDWQGATWLFQDEGTLAAFRDAPDVYAPLFGGRCAFSVSQGRPAEGSPQHFLILHGKLLLFADAAARTAFLLDPERQLDEAERRWPAMRAELP